MGESVKIAVVIDGGVVQDVLSAGVPVEYVIVDYDTDGAAPGELTAVPQDDGFGPTKAHVSHAAPATIDGPFVLGAFAGFADTPSGGNEAAGASVTPSEGKNGPYRPALAEAFRKGARELQIDRLDVPKGAPVEEGEGGAYVLCRVYVSDAERLPMTGEDGRCSACGGDLDNPSAAGAEDGVCGECIVGEAEDAPAAPLPGSYDSAAALARFDAGVTGDDACLAELQIAGWTERRAYVILAEHKAE